MLMAKSKYQEGMRIGPNHLLFVKELPKQGNHRIGLFECSECGRKDWKTSLDHILYRGDKRCPDCKKKRTREILVERNKKNAYDLTGKRINHLYIIERDEKRTKQYGMNIWKCKCDCGNIIYLKTASLSKRKARHSCGCMNKLINSKDLTGQRFGHLVALYPTDKRKYHTVVWRCKCDCGNEHETTSDCLLSGKSTSCGCMTISKGERKVKEILENKNILFESEKRFRDCRNSKTNALLPFDFYLPDYNCCIEYDGIQHFEETTWRHESLDAVQYRDSIKNQYCEDNNIKLIRIPYWDYDNLDEQYLLQKINE